MANTPEAFQWLLDFLNLCSIPSIPNPRKIRFSKNLNRTPTIPPKDVFNLETGYNGITDHKGYAWTKHNDKPKFIGKAKFFPRRDDFRKFFLESKVVNPYLVNDNILLLWNELSMAFSRISTNKKCEQEIGEGVLKSFCDRHLA